MIKLVSVTNIYVPIILFLRVIDLKCYKTSYLFEWCKRK